MNEIAQTPPRASNPTRMWDVFCHLSSLSALIGVPFGNIVGPLIIWLIRRGDMPSVDEHGKESLNFQISFTLWSICLFTVVGGLAALLMLVVVGFLLIPVLIMMAIAFPLINVILVIVASLKASDGEVYRYPLTVRFID